MSGLAETLPLSSGREGPRPKLEGTRRTAATLTSPGCVGFEELRVEALGVKREREREREMAFLSFRLDGREGSRWTGSDIPQVHGVWDSGV